MNFKKFFFNHFALICAFFVSSIQGFSREIFTEARAAYYYPTDERFRDIYDGAGLYSVEASFQGWKQLYPFASLGFLYASGSSVGEGDATRLYMVPIGLGLKCAFSAKEDRLRPYLGLGMQVAYVNIHNNYSFVDESQSGWGVGGIAKAGLLAMITKSIFCDFFMDYTYFKKDFNKKTDQLIFTHKGDFGGLSFGAGLGVRF